MKKLRVYLDTSVIAGSLDHEFSLKSNQLMEAIKQEKFILLMSDIIVSKLIIAFPNLMRYTKILTPDS
jgi:predicted nucleic acid-binding protein